MTSGASTGFLFRCLKQFGHVKKQKKYIQWKIHRNKSTSFFQVTVGYNQWCPRLHHKKRTVQAIPSMHTVQAVPSIHTVQAIPSKRKKGKKMGMEEKAVDLKKKEKDGEGRESG